VRDTNDKICAELQPHDRTLQVTSHSNIHAKRRGNARACVRVLVWLYMKAAWNCFTYNYDDTTG
jgi:hypothetical protein